MHMHDAAGRGQHGDGCRDSQGSPAPQESGTGGSVVHRGLPKKPELVIASCCTEWEVTAR